jgi:hypothetical protein
MAYSNATDFIFGILELQYDANAVVSQGDIVCIGDGYCNAGSTATGLRAIGVALDAVDNTGGAAAAATSTTPNGTIRVESSYPKGGGRKFFWLQNDTAGGALAQADVFTNPAYVKDAKTVSKTGTGRSKAGTVVAYDASKNLVGVLFDAIG